MMQQVTKYPTKMRDSSGEKYNSGTDNGHASNERVSISNMTRNFTRTSDKNRHMLKKYPRKFMVTDNHSILWLMKSLYL